MARFWIGFYSAEDRGLPATSDFRHWLTGWAPDAEGNDTKGTYCALVDAETIADAWEAVTRIWKDARERFIDEKPADWEPTTDRFVGTEP